MGLLAILVLLNSFGYIDFLKRPVFWATRPVFSISQSTANVAKGFFAAIVDLRGQLKEKKNLEQDVARLRSENALLRRQTRELVEVSDLLALKSRFDYQTVASTVVSKDPTGLKKSVTIDKGSESGISPGDAVLDSSGSLLGIVERSERGYSVFNIVTDGGIKIDAEALGSSAFLGIVAGSHGVGLTMELISQEVSLEKGTEVVTSGITGRIPAGILIGYIEDSQSKEVELFQSASLVPAAKLQNFNNVLVITGF